MDGGGRLTRPLRAPVEKAGGPRARDARSVDSAPPRAPIPRAAAARLAREERAGHGPLMRLVHLVETKLPRGAGVAATVLVLVVSLGFGVVKGGHVDGVAEGARDIRDAIANAAGFRIDALAINGRKHLSEQDVLEIAGIGERRSLLFLDAATVRERLRASPWIGEATVLKLYPDRLQIDIEENPPFALWQKDGRVAVISESGAVLQDEVPKRLATLPFFVGKGAASRAGDFLALMERFPQIKEATRAMVLVGERRWNLYLKNGIDVRLPEYDVERALQRLNALAQEKQILTRDITAIDLRLPDRIAVRLSEDAFAARQEALKAAAKAKRNAAKAGDA